MLILSIISTSNTGLARRPKRSISTSGGISITNSEALEVAIESARDLGIYSLSISLFVIYNNTLSISEKSLLAL